MENPTVSGKWKCTKCNTWCDGPLSRCSWCGAGRPDLPRSPSSITESAGTPPEIREEQELLNKIRILAAKCSVEQKKQLLKYIEETFKV